MQRNNKLTELTRSLNKAAIQAHLLVLFAHSGKPFRLSQLAQEIAGQSIHQ